MFADGTMVEPGTGESMADSESAGIVRVSESADGYHISVEMPGWFKDEILVHVDGRRVEISTRPRVTRRRAEASYRAGKLELHLPVQRDCEHGKRLIVN